MKTLKLLKLSIIMGGVAAAANSSAWAEMLEMNPQATAVAVPADVLLNDAGQSVLSPEMGSALAGDPMSPMKVTPDVAGIQRALVVGCRFADTVDTDILNTANEGIRGILDRMHEYFDVVSNQRVNFQADFDSWQDLPKSSDDYASGDQAIDDCKNIARRVVDTRGTNIGAYRAVVMLFNRDKHISNGTEPGGAGEEPRTWIHLRYSGGTGGGWTSEALWAHELGHAFGLVHSTFPTREAGNQYNDFQDALSGFGQSSKHRWNFRTVGVCNGMLVHPECLYSGRYDNVPVHFSAFQKQRLGWLFPDQVAYHWGGTADYQLSAPTYDPRGERPLFRQKLVVVKVPYSTAYYAIEYRRGDHGDKDNRHAFDRGWDYHEAGIRSDRVTVYLVKPDLYSAKDDLGDANLEAVLKPGERFTAGPENPAIDVLFKGLADNDVIAMRANVAVTTALPAPPSTVLSAAGMDGAWANQDVIARLFARPNWIGTPIAKTYYGIDDPGCNEQTRDCPVFADSFTIAGEGEHDVTYFSADVAGGVEKPNHKTVRIDKSAPSTAVSVSTAGYDVQLMIAASDALSGVRETSYEIDGTGFVPYREPVKIAPPGPHTVRIQSVDNAGNVEATQAIAVNVPALPLTASAQATPSLIKKPNGRAVKVHVDIRTTAVGATLRLDGVSHSGRGRHKGWRLNSADVDGAVYAIRGETYTLRYTVTDASGRTQPVSAKIVVSR